jgi:3-isopropylmalate/(R)-2-methylmalate dehydratase small subunit
MKFVGKVWKFGDNIDTDAIIPARYLNTFDPDQLAGHCFVDFAPEFGEQVKPGDIIVAGGNFGCGSSREHAPAALSAKGISVVVAASFARIFYRNSFNTGMPILECPEAVETTDQGDILAVDTDSGSIVNQTKNLTFKAQPIPPFMQELIADGGLIPHIKKKISR